jgi:hypothetical protein
MSDRIIEESAERALELALSTIKTFEMDGEDSAVIFAVFAIAGSIYAQMNNKSKETYLKFCGMFYDETTRSLKDIGLLE